MQQETELTVNASRVKVKISYKVNMGNYETLGLEYGVDADAQPGESTRDALLRVEELVSDILFNEVKRVKESLK